MATREGALDRVTPIVAVAVGTALVIDGRARADVVRVRTFEPSQKIAAPNVLVSFALAHEMVGMRRR